MVMSTQLVKSVIDKLKYPLVSSTSSNANGCYGNGRWTKSVVNLFTLIFAMHDPYHLVISVVILFQFLCNHLSHLLCHSFLSSPLLSSLL